MKYPTLQKVTLTTLALVALLALNAQAGTPTFSSSRQAFGPAKSVNPIHRLLFPASTYMYDDGTSEQSIAFGDGTQNFESLWFNQFAVIPGSNVITSVSVNWGTPLFPESGLNGTAVTIAVWSDPNGDGQPFDAVLLGSVAGTIQNADTDTLVTYTFTTPVTVPGTSFFVGDMTPAQSRLGELFYQGQDTTNSAPNKAWVAANSTGAPVDINNVGNNDFIGTIDSFGLPGDWTIRADASGGGGGIVLEANVRRQQGRRVVALNWSPADGGSINILRNGVVIGTTDDDGTDQDNIHGQTGAVTYQVCETDTGNCSNEVRIIIR